MGIDPNWYKDMLGSIMKGHPGSGILKFGIQASQATSRTMTKRRASKPERCRVQRVPRPPEGTGRGAATARQPGSRSHGNGTAGQITLTAYIPGIRTRTILSIRLHGDTLYVSGKNQDPLERRRRWQGPGILPGDQAAGRCAQRRNQRSLRQRVANC